jgi:hypothetical protein
MGVPAALSGASSDKYLAATGLPADIALGQQFWNPTTGHKRMLVKTSGVVTPNQSVAYDAAQANNFTVVACPTGQTALGVNDLSGATTAVGDFIWITCGGPVTPLVAANVAAGVTIGCNAVAGTLATVLAADVYLPRIETRAASGGAGGATACWMFSSP